MKCWTRYVLPLVMALCLFLGSSFFSLEVDAQETDSDAIDYGACITECKELADVIEKSFGDSFYYLGSYSLVHGIQLAVSSTPIYVTGQGGQYLNIYGIDVSFFTLGSDFSYVCNSSNYSGSYSVSLIFNAATAFSNHDILYKDTGELFFRGPSPFQRVVQAQDWTAVMMEIVMVLPLLIVSLTSLIGLRKGLRFISTLLHQA